MNYPDEQLDIAQLKIPPNSVEAEQSVIGALLISPDAWDTVSEILTAEDFYRPEHRVIFQRMAQLAEDGIRADIVTVPAAMTQHHELDRAGGFIYLAEISRSTPSAANVLAYAHAVKRASRGRKLISSAMRMGEIAWDMEIDIEQREELVQAELMLFGDMQGEDIISTNQAIKEVIDEIDKRHTTGKSITGLTTGFDTIDRRTRGLQPTDLILIGGRPSMGKTALAMNIVEHVAFKSRLPVLVFSMEMSRSQLLERMIASIGDIGLKEIQTGGFADEDWKKTSNAVSIMKDSPLIVDERPSLSIQQVRSRARKLHKKTPLKLIVIDYLQQMVGKISKNENREQEISSISRGLKSIAKELGCPVIAITQLNRGPEQRQDKRPKNSDLRDSGQLEQDADLICMVYRDDYYNENTLDKRVLELIWTKNRNGEIGKDYLRTNLARAKIENIESGFKSQASNIVPIRGGQRGFDDDM